MEQRCKWMVYGSDGVGGKGCTRALPVDGIRPEVAPAPGRSWAAFRITGFLALALPVHASVVRNFEGRAVPHRSIRA
jgi:hypothetical protein